ncbi:MAG: GtrA family protein, partial [Gaiellaceae bacterium]
MVGAIGFIVDFGIFNLAHSLGFGGWFANNVVALVSRSLAETLAAHPEIIEQTLSLGIAIASNFVWNYFWIYPEARAAKQSSKMVKFVVVSIVGLIFGVPIFSVALVVWRGVVEALHLT